MIKLLAFFRRDAHADIETLSAQVDGRLDPGRAAALKAHLSSCEACGRRLEELRAVRSALGAMPMAEPGRSFRLSQSDVQEAAMRAADGGAARVLRLMPAMSTAAVVLFAALLGVDALSSREGGSAQSSSKSAAAPAAEQSKNTLVNAPTPHAADADKALGLPPPVPSGGVARIEPAQTVPEGTFPAAQASGIGAAPSPEAAQPLPTSQPFRDARAEGETGGGYTGIRIAEAIVAAVAVSAGAAAVFGRRRSRGVDR